MSDTPDSPGVRHPQPREVALSRTGGYTGGINGELKLYGTAALGTAFAELDAATITDADFSEGDTTTATLSGGTAKFFKAVVE